jgi:hypothetical protein
VSGDDDVPVAIKGVRGRHDATTRRRDDARTRTLARCDVM